MALLLGVAAAVAVLGSACGQYANVHHDRAVAAQQASVNQKADPAPATHTVSGSTSGDAAAARKADGASGPGPDALQGGGGPTVDLSRIFPVNKSSGSASSQQTSGNGTGPGSSPTNSGSNGSKGSSTGKQNASGGSKQGSGGSKQSGIRGDDGANPGPPDIQGSIGPGSVPAADSLDLASLVSRETVQGAKYNSTVLPVGFPFSICPVQGKFSYSDSYGAARYAGGYHPHAGVDIFADQGTPIVAPFAGSVERDPNTLGGNAVIVRGAQGYVYMAHLVAYGITDRNVEAGTVVGFVGNTGDAQGTSYHDHFEWHPTHVAAYDRVISGTNGAVDPFPYLQVVCPPQPA